MGDYLKSTASFTVEKVLTSSANPETLCRIRQVPIIRTASTSPNLRQIFRISFLEPATVPSPTQGAFHWLASLSELLSCPLDTVCSIVPHPTQSQDWSVPDLARSILASEYKLEATQSLHVLCNLPTSMQCRSINEISGLWPGAKVVRSLKQDMTLEGVWTPSLGSPFSIASAIRTGLLQPWSQGNKATFLPDRYDSSQSATLQSMPALAFSCT